MSGILEKPRGNLPELSFTDTDFTQIKAEVLAKMQEYCGEILLEGDARVLVANALLESLIQTRILTDIAAKKTLLSYATGDYLDHLASLFGITRPAAKSATCSAIFTRSESDFFKSIPAGIEVSGGGFIWTSSRIIFQAGYLESNEVILQCTSAGTAANDIPVGAINTIVSPNTILKSVTNTAITTGGSDLMEDEEFIELIRDGSDALSVAGPIHAYEYFAKNAHPEIQDIKIYSPNPGIVEIYVLKNGGIPPTETDGILQAVLDACSADTVRPVGDRVQSLPPELINYSITLHYSLTPEQVYSSGGLENAQNKIIATVEEFKVWQRSKIGLNLSQGRLVKMVMDAGASNATADFSRQDQEDDLSAIEYNQVANCIHTLIIFDGVAE